MLPSPISFELPDWGEPLSVERADRLGWFEQLIGPDGDGAALTSLFQLGRRPLEVSGDN